MRTLLVMVCAAAAMLFAVPAKAAPVTKRLAVVVIQNGDTPGEQTALADTGYVRNVFLGSSGSLVSWTTAVTRGQLTFVPAGDGVYTTQPSDELRDADKAGCHHNLATATAESHLKSLGLEWDSLAIVFDIASCGWGGLGQMPGRITWYPPRPHIAAVVHEFGHNHGYPHASKRDCAGGNLASCKGNGECCSGNTPMGGGGDQRGYSSVELLHSGWIDAGSKVVATKPGNFSLKPLYASGSGMRVVEYKAGSSLIYVIETRASGNGIDNAINNPGVRVYAVTNGDYRHATMINPGSGYLPSGAAITDTASKLRITVRSSSTSGAIVAVETLGASPSARPSPTPSPSPPESPTPSPSDSASADPVPDNDFLDTSATQPADGGLSLKLVLVAIGLLLVVIMLGVCGHLLRSNRRRSRHRRPQALS